MLWPIIDIVTRAADLLDEDTVEESRARIASLLPAEVNRSIVARHVSEAIGIGGTPGVAAESFWAIRSFLEGLALRTPLVLEFDDIQFGEPTFLELVEHIADWSRDVPIMLVCIARPDLLDAHRSWGGGKLNATSLLLEPLTGEDGDLLVQNLLGSEELARSDRGRIVEVAGGNPLFVEEILSMLIDDGVLMREGDRWVPSDDLTSVAIPPTISALLAARLDRLSPDERAVIEHAAVVGKQFSVEAVAGLLPEDLAAGIDDSLSSLVRKELLKPARSQDVSRGHFDYRHILIRDAAYDSIPKNVRAALHERYATWLEGHPPGRRDEIEEILGYHLEQAHRYRMEVGPFDEHVSELARRAGLTLASAGRAAAVRGDASAAVNLLGRAARLLPRGDATRLELLPSLYDSLYDVGALEDAASLLAEIRDAARQRGDRALETRATIDERWWEFMKDPGRADLGALRHDLEDAAALFRELDDHWNLAIVLESLATVHWVTGAAGAMLEEAERGLALARQAGNRRMVARTASNLASALLMGPTPYPEALDRMETLADDLADDRLAQSTVQCSIAIVLASLGRFDLARAQAADARAVFADLGQRRWLVNVSAIVGLISLDEGLLAEAEREIRSAYDFFRDHRDALNAPGLACDLARVLLLQGRDDEADMLASEAAETGGIDLEPQVRWRGIRALVLARRGETVEAEALARQGLSLVAPTDFVGLRADASTDLALVLISIGRRSEARGPITEALTLYGSKGDIVGAEFARSLR
jgi:tetratricopeptide (TPR) repeat protein